DAAQSDGREEQRKAGRCHLDPLLSAASLGGFHASRQRIVAGWPRRTPTGRSRAMDFATACRSAPVMLTDGGIETRLIYEDRLDLPEFASFLPLVRPGERRTLEAIYDSYLAVAAESGLPMQLGTPTWRAHPECL